MMSISSLGQVMQLAFVPDDFYVAVNYWTKTMKVGPFFYLQHIKPPSAWYRGVPTNFDFSIALAYWGDIQIELIEIHDDTPSIYREWRQSGKSGLHHTCLEVDDLEHAKRVCHAADVEIVQEFLLDGGGAIYVDTGGGPGTILEILQPTKELSTLFSSIHAASVAWEGEQPLRSLG